MFCSSFTPIIKSLDRVISDWPLKKVTAFDFSCACIHRFAASNSLLLFRRKQFALIFSKQSLCSECFEAINLQ